MSKGGRTKNTFIKDLRYEKYFVISFVFRTLTFVYCKPKGKDNYTFVPLEITKSTDLEDINIVKFSTEVAAKATLKKIPPVDIGGYDVYLEVIPNTFIADLLFIPELD